MSKTIHNYSDLLSHVECEDWDEFERVLFKYTDCGMCVRKIHNGIRLTGYVECDYDFCGDSEDLVFPFSSDEFNDVCDALDKRACKQWEFLNATDEQLGIDDASLKAAGIDPETFDKDAWRWDMVANY